MARKHGFDFDLFTIGAGSGGVRASRRAADLGFRVGLAESYRMGGTCVIRGCIPKKLFAYASAFHGEAETAKGFGWTHHGLDFSWDRLKENKDKEIARLSGLYQKNLEKSKVALFETKAVLKDANTIHLVAENRTVTAKTILIASGGTPFRPPEIEGKDYAITSNEAFELSQLPDEILIMGGGYIAVEFASIYHGLGVKTTLMYRGDTVLRGFDDGVRDALQQALKQRGITVLTDSALTKITPAKKGFEVTTNHGETLTFACVMAATGRIPLTQGMGLDKAGVDVDAKGAVAVDAYSRTCVANIYAIGDVTNRCNLTPIAIREAEAFVQTVFNATPTAVNYAMTPKAVFTEPVVGTVGLSEAEAVARYKKVDIYETHFRPLKSTLSPPACAVQNFMKVVVNAQNQKVLGVHIMGEGAAEMIQAVSIAVTMGATKADFDATIAVHPTSCEELVTLRDKRLGRAGATR